MIRNKNWGEFPGGTVVKTWAFTAVDPGSIPGRGNKIPQAAHCSQKRKIFKKNLGEAVECCHKKDRK